MRNAIILLVAILGVVGTATSARAQSIRQQPLVSSRPSGTRTNAKPLFHFDFRPQHSVPATIASGVPMRSLQKANASLPLERTPIDCKMVKPVDPHFVSAMPVVRPDPTIALPMRIAHAAPCRE